MYNMILSSERKVVVNQMKKLGSRLGKNILERGDYRCNGSVAGVSVRIFGNDSGLEWLERREKESLEREEAGGHGSLGLLCPVQQPVATCGCLNLN